MRRSTGHIEAVLSFTVIIVSSQSTTPTRYKGVGATHEGRDAIEIINGKGQ